MLLRNEETRGGSIARRQFKAGEEDRMTSTLPFPALVVALGALAGTASPPAELRAALRPAPSTR
jgi:hypothetical protein